MWLCVSLPGLNSGCDPETKQINHSCAYRRTDSTKLQQALPAITLPHLISWFSEVKQFTERGIISGWEMVVFQYLLSPT